MKKKKYKKREPFNEEVRGKATLLSSEEIMTTDVDILLTTKEASEYLTNLPGTLKRKVSAATLAKYRSMGQGPIYMMDRDTRTYRYHPEDLKFYAGNICKKSTKHIFNLVECVRVVPPRQSTFVPGEYQHGWFPYDTPEGGERPDETAVNMYSIKNLEYLVERYPKKAEMIAELFPNSFGPIFEKAMQTKAPHLRPKPTDEEE